MEGESPVLGGMAALGMAVLGMLVLSSMASAAPSFSPEDDPYSGVVVARPAPPLPTKLRQAVLLDPQVAEASARACQMAHRLGLARNKGRPQVSASITGSRQLVGRIKKISQGRTILDGNRIRQIPPPHYAEEIRRSGAHTREFDHHEKNNIYDGKVSVRHTFLDWGQQSNLNEARRLALEAARIGARGLMRERSHELLRLALLLRRAEDVIAVRKAGYAAVQADVESVRARVEAGVGRVAELREAQLVALDQEIAINRVEAERDQIRERMIAEFDIDETDAHQLVQTFMSRRPVNLPVLQAGTMLAEIVPAEAEYLVRAQVLPQNVKDVQPGQIARISLAAYDPSRYGVIMGVVRQVASNTTQPENAMPFYETVIAIPEVVFTKSPDIPIITAGMPLQVDILGGKRTIMNYIMTPIQKSLATAFREK